jgi:hypothetical protein
MDSNRAIRSAVFAAMISVMGWSQLFAQTPPRQLGMSVREALDRFAADQVEPRAWISPLGGLLFNPQDYSSAVVDSVISGLAEFTLHLPNDRARGLVAAWLADLGNREWKQPVPGMVGRLAHLYGETSDELVHRILLWKMAHQAEERAAIEFLRRIATREPSACGGCVNDTETEQMLAVAGLAEMNTDAARATLRELYNGRQVRDGVAVGYLNYLAQREFRAGT